ncbi:DUF3168 domain-containing protein [Novosphingobium sp. BL-8H]|uniref:DUF3168 domain-containing protein n=1 Tax=Novosphingobium sp. BL-8H TaxID=3127640 RepID=UPI003757F6AB
MEIALRAALVDWLATDPLLGAELNAVVEEAPSRTSLPWLAIASSASADWSCKTAPGREVRVALELHCRGDAPDTAAMLVAAIEGRVEALPRDQAAFRIVGIQFLRARAEQRGESRRAILLEYRFRLMAE